MADRSVSVDLQLRVDRYKVSAEEAKRATEDIDDKVKKTNDDLDKTTARATRAAAAIRLMGAESGATGIALEESGGKGSTAIGQIDTRLQEARANLRKLAEEFNSSGSLDVYQKLTGAQKDVKGLERISKDLTGAINAGVIDAKVVVEKTLGDAVKGGAGNGIMSALSGTDSPMALGIVAAVPFIAGAVSLAIESGVGLGLVGLAGYLQRSDPDMISAFGKLKDDAIGVFTDSSTELAKPFIQALSSVDTWIVGLAPELRAAFGSVAPAIKPLVGILTGILDPVIRELPAVGAAFAKAFSDPTNKAMLTSIGSDIADVLGTIAANGNVIRTTFSLVGVAVKIVTTAFDLLLNTLNAVERPWVMLSDRLVGMATGDGSWKEQAAQVGAFSGSLNPVIENMRTFADEVAQTPAGLDALAQKLNTATTSADSLAGAMTDKLLGSMLGIQNATLSLHVSLSDLQDALAKNGNNFDENTRKGQANMQALLQVVSANKSAYDANIANGMSAQAAAHQFDMNTASLNVLLKKAGLTDAQIHTLTGTLNDVPDKVNTNIAMNGLTQALNDLDDLLRQLNGLPSLKKVTVEYTEKVNTLGPRIAYASGGIRHAATGLIVRPRAPGTLIGEPQTGGEALIPLRGISAGSAAALGEVAMSGYGMTVVPRSSAGAAGGVRVSLSVNTGAGGTPIQQAFNAYFQDALRTGQIQIKASQIG